MIHFEHVSIASLTHVDAPVRVTTQAIESELAVTLARVGLGADVLSSLTGIHARRFWPEGTTPSAAATLAAEEALRRARVDRAKVGVLVSTSVSKDYIEPSVAALVHGNLGLTPSCLNFDVGNACLAFLTGMQVVGDMIERGHVDYGLVVDGESSRDVVRATIARLARTAAPLATAQDVRDNLATLTLGSGAAAAVLARREHAPRAPRLTGMVSRAATQHRNLCRGQIDGMITDAGALLGAGVELAAATFDDARAHLGWEPSAFDEIVLHQVSAVHTAKIVARLGLDAAKVLPIYPEHGNVGPASIPMALAKAAAQERIGRGSRVALMGIGSGLNCAMMEIVW